MTLQEIDRAIREAAAFRRLRRLQPVGGPGDFIFPPTYPGARRTDPPRHVFERRLRPASEPNGGDGQSVWTVLLDSVQSQANRLEEALLGAADEGLPLPFVTVDFRDSGLKPLERITSLEAPHRVYDAILRDSVYGGDPFMRSEPGRRLASASLADATALLELSPNALVFGAWHSQGQGGGLGAKFPRVLVSEIIGVDVPVLDREGAGRPVPAGRRPGSRIDPLGIRLGVTVFADKHRNWSTTKAKGMTKKKPSEVNHGNIAPTVAPLGVTFAFAEQRVVISCAGLRRLRFGGPTRDAAGRALLAALGLMAIAEQDMRGYALRSRCDLVCDGRAELEIVEADGSVRPVALDRAGARTLYRQAYREAANAGFRFESLTLTPQEKLVEIVRQSRDMALAGRGGEEDDG